MNVMTWLRCAQFVVNTTDICGSNFDFILRNVED